MTTTQKYEVVVWKESEWFVSWCRELDVASQGQTVEEAIENLKEAIALHLEPPNSDEPEEH
jgi:predicted RNase H-like HicB family nuclease